MRAPRPQRVCRCHKAMSPVISIDTMTFNSATFGSLAYTGTYTWTWGTGANQNFTLQIGPAGYRTRGRLLAFSFCLNRLVRLNRLRHVHWPNQR